MNERPDTREGERRAPGALTTISRPTARDRARLDDLAARLTEHDLRPLVDPELAVIVCDCPECRAGDRDPRRLWRPLMVTPRGRKIIFRCCACDTEVIRDAR
jgi:hypothetical protein